MSSLLRFLSFVPPILFFVCPAFSQLQGTISKLPGGNTYQVSILPTQDIALPLSTTSSAQITLRASSGKLNLTNFQSLTGDWEMQSQYISPAEAPNQDYFRFFLINPFPSISYSNGVEIPLFSFENLAPCTTIELVDNDTDPFVSNNSLMVDARNYFALLLDPGGNSYEGNTANSSVSCPQLDLQITADNNPLNCFGDLTNMTVKALKGNEPYTVVHTHLSSGATDSGNINDFEGSVSFLNLPGGEYEFRITDAQDSISFKSYNVVQPAALTVDLEPALATCTGSKDGAVRISGVSGLGGPDFGAYQYYWNIDPTNSNIEIDSLGVGTYTVTVVDANGCTTVASTIVDVFNQLFIPSEIKQISCFGKNDGVIKLYPFGVSAPYTYQWSPNANSGMDQSDAWMLGPGEYHVTVTAAEVCTRTEVFIIEEPAEIHVEYELMEPECYGDEAYLNIISIANVQGIYEVDIVGNHTQISDFSYEVEPGVPIQLTVTDELECEIKEDFIIPNKQEMMVDLGDDRTIKYGESITVEAEVFPLTGTTLEWTPSEGLDCIDCPNPTAAPLEDVTYVLSLINDNGCFVEDDITITVNKSRDIYIPNAFSPNKDGINDFFRPFGGFEIVQIQSLMVFNRWGGLIYQNEDGFTLEEKDVGWNGYANGKEIDPGTYLYTMNVQFIDGETVLFTGEVNLIK